jgi:hypothetical protein
MFRGPHRAGDLFAQSTAGLAHALIGFHTKMARRAKDILGHGSSPSHACRILTVQVAALFLFQPATDALLVGVFGFKLFVG